LILKLVLLKLIKILLRNLM